MKNLIYMCIIAVLLLGSLFVLGLYYTQDFNVNFNLKDSISYNDIGLELRDQKDYNNNNTIYTYISSASSVLGELTLDNTNGIFTKIYSPPILFGCIDLNENTPVDSPLRHSNKFTVSYVQDDQGINTRDYYNYNNPEDIKIKVGEKKIVQLNGQYTSNNIKLNEFSKEYIDSISVYMIDEKAENPLSEDYYNNYNLECWDIRDKAKLVEKISII